MAKGIAKKETRMSNTLRISTCEQCKGQPKAVPFKSPPHEGMRCDDCWEIISFEKISSKPKTNEVIQKEQKQVDSGMEDKDSPFRP